MCQVKICGLTNFDDAWAAAQAGADFLGFIFHEPSPRYVSPETAAKIVSGVRGAVSSRLPQFVGVFVNSPLEMVKQILAECGLDMAQLHGDESPEFVNQFKGRAYKALRPQSLEEAELLTTKYLSSAAYTSTPCFLLDAYHPTLYGGTGYVTDWTMAAVIAAKYPLMLAGSLTPDNVVEAIHAVNPWGVDVSSGVEAGKGKKDHHKVQEFVQVVKNTQIN